MQAITLRPQNDQQMRLIKQLAKTLDIEVTLEKVKTETPKQRKERAFLDRLERSARQVKSHIDGEIKLKSARQVFNEL